MAAERGDRFAAERSWRHLWRWLTRNGTVNPDETPPQVEVSGTVTANLDSADDEVAVFGAEDGGAGTRRIVNVDSSGRVRTVGAAADGAAVAGNPVLVAGQDGTNTQSLLTDSEGRQVVVGPSAAGAAIAGNPVMMGVSDGTNARFAHAHDNASDAIVTNATGRHIGTTGFGMVYNGTTWDRMRGGTDGLTIKDGGNSITVDQATASSLNAQVVGNVAHDASDSGNPVKVGGKAVAHATDPTSVAAAERTDWLYQRSGIPFVIGGHPNVISTEYRWDTAQTNDDVLGAIGAAEACVVTGIALTLDEATTVGVKARVGFGASAVPTEPADGASVNGMILSHSGFVPGGGIVRGGGSGILGQGAAGEELRITAEAPTTGSARLTITWYKMGV